MIKRIEKAYKRLDLCLSELLEEESRSQIQKLIRAGDVLVNGKILKAGASLKPGDTLEVHRPEPKTEGLVAQDLPLDIRYEDQDLLVINKARGMVVHPAPGHYDKTLVNALLAHYPLEAAMGFETGRPGIVHRIDKDTEGLLMVAKTRSMHMALAALIKEHAVKRSYKALVYGQLPSSSGLIDAPIGRDPKDRKKMAVVASGKVARTHFESLQSFRKGSELALNLETGRTHQIRVHLKYLGHPVVADPLYAKGKPTYGLEGQALFAYQLVFEDPRDGKLRRFVLDNPPWYEALRARMEAE